MDEKAENFFFKVEEFLSPRRREILKMKLEGSTLREIGDCFGLSQKRAREILKEIDKEVLKILDSQLKT